MKTKILLMMAMLVVVSGGRLKATHHLIEDGDYFGNLFLDNDDTLLMTGGEGDDLVMSGSSVATIENTHPIIGEENGGIWEVVASSSSIFNLNGGEINSLETWWYGTINMTGGNVFETTLNNYSLLNLSGGQVGQLTITSVESWAILDGYGFSGYVPGNPITGYWHDDTAFSIDLVDDGISTYGQIIFIPEPVSVLLLGIGGLISRKRVNG